MRQPILLLACLVIVTISVSAQDKKTTQKAAGSRVVPEIREFSFEAAAEKLVRAAYAKLTRYNKASLSENDRRYSNIPVEERYLHFELSNFSGGPIQEILNLPHDEVQTIATEIVQLGRGVHTLNNADPHVAYSAEWIIEQYAPLYNPKWTVNDLFSYDIARYRDVGAYVKYDVTLRLHGKVRSYSAVTLFRNPYGSVENLKPLFWDIVVGSAGALESLWYEQRRRASKGAEDSTAEVRTIRTWDADIFLRRLLRFRGNSYSCRQIHHSSCLYGDIFRHCLARSRR
jgi:hypothetical protein